MGSKSHCYTSGISAAPSPLLLSTHQTKRNYAPNPTKVYRISGLKSSKEYAGENISVGSIRKKKKRGIADLFRLSLSKGEFFKNYLVSAFFSAFFSSFFSSAFFAFALALLAFFSFASAFFSIFFSTFFSIFSDFSTAGLAGVA